MRFIGLTKRLITMVLLTSTLVTTVLSVAQLVFEYRAERGNVEANLAAFERTGVEGIRSLMWVMDDQGLARQTEVALGIREIVALKVVDESGNVVVEKTKNRDVTRHEVRKYELKGEDGRSMGTLEVDVSLDELFALMRLRLVSLLLTNFLKTVIVASLLTVMIRRSFVKPVLAMADHFNRRDVNDAGWFAEIPRARTTSVRDELDDLLDGINENKHRMAELYYANQQLIANQQQSIENARAQLVESESALREEQVRSMQAARMAELGTLAGGVAHEINNPLAIVFGYMDMLEKIHNTAGAQSPQFGTYVKKIQANLTRIKGIVHGLKTYARDGSGDPLTPVSVNQLVSETVDLCKEMAMKRKVELQTVLLERDHEVNCRPSQIMQVLVNLVNNASDAIESLPERWIRVSVVLTDGAIGIRVTDSGPGIPAEVANRLFTPFFTTKPVGKGTGLGLSIARGIIDQHKGKLTLNRESDHTEFEVSLPTAA